MKLTAKTELIKEIVDIADGIGALELRLHIDADKLWYRVVDSGNVAMASVEIPAECFSEYSFEPSQICVDLKKLKNVFGFGGKEIVINRESLQSNAIVVECGGYKSTQTLLHDSTVRKDPNMPALELPGKVDMIGKEFAAIIKNISTESDKIRMVIADNVFGIETVNEGQDNVVKPLSADELINISGVANSLFSADYLIGMARNWGVDISIELGNDFPIIVSFSIAGGHGTAKYLLAPRIEQE